MTDESKAQPEEPKGKVCTQCGKEEFAFVESAGGFVCKTCGLVVPNQPMMLVNDITYVKSANSDRCCKTGTTMRLDGGCVSTMLSRGTRDVCKTVGAKFSGYDRRQMKFKKMFETLIRPLGITDSNKFLVRNIAESLHHGEGKSVKGMEATVGAAAYIVSRENGGALTLADVSRKLNVPTARLHEAFHTVVEATNRKPCTSRPTTATFLDRGLSALEPPKKPWPVDFKITVRGQAKNLMDLAASEGLDGGRNASALCGAVLRVVMEAHALSSQQERLANVLSVSPGTISKRHKELMDMIVRHAQTSLDSAICHKNVNTHLEFILGCLPVLTHMPLLNQNQTSKADAPSPPDAAETKKVESMIAKLGLRSHPSDPPSFKRGVLQRVQRLRQISAVQKELVSQKKIELKADMAVINAVLAVIDENKNDSASPASSSFTRPFDAIPDSLLVVPRNAAASLSADERQCLEQAIIDGKALSELIDLKLHCPDLSAKKRKVPDSEELCDDDLSPEEEALYIGSDEQAKKKEEVVVHMEAVKKKAKLTKIKKEFNARI